MGVLHLLLQLQEVQPSVLDVAALGPEVPQVNEEHFAAMQNDTSNVISQPHPEETPGGTSTHVEFRLRFETCNNGKN